MIAAVFADLFEDFGEFVLLDVLLLELLMDRAKRLAVHAARFGQRSQRFGQMRQISQKLVLTLGLRIQVLADAGHQVGQRAKALLKLIDSLSVRAAQGTQEGAAMFHRIAAIVRERNDSPSRPLPLRRNKLPRRSNKEVC